MAKVGKKDLFCETFGIESMFDEAYTVTMTVNSKYFHKHCLSVWATYSGIVDKI